MNKMPTYLFRKVFLILSAAPAFGFFMGSLIGSLGLELPSELMMIATLFFIVSGIMIGLLTSKKIRHLTLTDRREDALRFGKKTNKYFIGVAILCWILCFLIAYFIPAPKDFRIRGYNAVAKNDLRNFYIAAQSYYQQNPNESLDIDIAIKYGFKPTYNVKLDVQSDKQISFKATAAHPGGTEIYTIDNKGVISATKKKSRDQY
jgi:hypothetical protein